MKRHVRGVTILEILITLFLFSVVLAMVANLARNYRDVEVHMASKSKTQASNLMLMSALTDIGGAMNVVSPAPLTGPQSEVIVERYTTASRRFVGTETRTNWDVDERLRVRYHLAQGKLFREVTFPDGSIEQAAIGEGLSGFSALRVNERAVELRASYQESKLVKSTAVTAYTWSE